MQSVALSWLVYRMTKFAAALGSVECAQLSPMLVLGLVGGAVADRFDRKNVILITQAVAMCQAIVFCRTDVDSQSSDLARYRFGCCSWNLQRV